MLNTPNANRLHIGIFGKRNSGKSSLINAVTAQETALVSDVAGTTTDPVYKAMEIHGLGACLLIDTAGFDDTGALGTLRVQKTRDALEKIDVAVLLCGDAELSIEREWVAALRERGRPIVAVISKSDLRDTTDATAAAVKSELGLSPIVFSAKNHTGISELIEEIIRLVPEDFGTHSIIGRLARRGDRVLLVMPQDIQAPKGRLILPQVQTIRELLDLGCVVTCVTADGFSAALDAAASPPTLIITDSQAFPQVYAKKPAESQLTSFSVLMAAAKGDIETFIEGAAAIDSLTVDSRVLIAEACTHAPLEEDIGRVKIPRLLRQRFGEALQIDIVSGSDFPAELSEYSLIIHCGACMFNRRHVLSRIERAKSQRVPITNYGIALAKLGGILGKIAY